LLGVASSLLLHPCLLKNFWTGMQHLKFDLVELAMQKKLMNWDDTLQSIKQTKDRLIAHIEKAASERQPGADLVTNK